MGIFGPKDFAPKKVPERKKKADSLNELAVNEPDTRAEFERDKLEVTNLKGAKLRTDSGELYFVNGDWRKGMYLKFSINLLRIRRKRISDLFCLCSPLQLSGCIVFAPPSSKYHILI